MEYVLGILAGLIYGGLVGLFKYLFLWKRLLREKDDTITMKMVTIRIMISYGTNILALVAVLFIKDLIPVDFIAFAVSTAIALSLSGKVLSMPKILEKTEMK
ncbi:MAG: hypothetical protein ACK5MV_07935 [Aminipila sp.]